MTSYDDDNTDYDDDTTEDTSSQQPGWRRKLEKDAKLGREAQEKAAALERRLAFAEAGIKSDDPKMSYFVKGYDGEITAEAIRKAAEDAGFIGGEQAVAPGPDADLQALDRVSQASAGAGVAPAEDAVQRLMDADRTGGRDAVLDQLRKDGLVEVY